MHVWRRGNLNFKWARHHHHTAYWKIGYKKCFVIYIVEDSSRFFSALKLGFDEDFWLFKEIIIEEIIVMVVYYETGRNLIQIWSGLKFFLMKDSPKSAMKWHKKVQFPFTKMCVTLLHINKKTNFPICYLFSKLYSVWGSQQQ